MDRIGRSCTQKLSFGQTEQRASQYRQVVTSRVLQRPKDPDDRPSSIKPLVAGGMFTSLQPRLVTARVGGFYRLSTNGRGCRGRLELLAGCRGGGCVLGAQHGSGMMSTMKCARSVGAAPAALDLDLDLDLDCDHPSSSPIEEIVDTIYLPPLT